MNAINHSMGPVEWILLITLSILWGGSFFFVGVAVDALGPLTIVALRVGLAAIALNLVVVLMGLRMPAEKPMWKAFFGMGLLNNMIPFTLIVWGQAYIASGLASILNASTIFFTVIAAHYLTQDERLTGGRFAGVVLGIAGVVFMVGTEALSGLSTQLLAQLAVLGGALSYAFAGIYGRRFRILNSPPLVTATGQVTASALVLIPLALLLERPWLLPMPSATVWAAILGLALLSTALAYILYFRVLSTAGATNILLVTFLIPVSAILLGTVFLGEKLELKHFTGMAFIAIGLAAIDGRPLKAVRLWLSGSPPCAPAMPEQVTDRDI
ncbi:DMT family transporter [Nitrincola alkalilacustris]|uniref:DMT family transporter n=1 Tax=Nitrincola alkalilacustris TaxID=1571224 RepID=UPI001980EBAD|nr:DMT family transporter [Nitrincola alkalilacustris]